MIYKNGIDVSGAQYEKRLDMTEMKKTGQLNFALIRAGYGITVKQKDRNFENFVLQVKINQIPFGVYWFIYARNVTEAEQNAHACAQVIEPYKHLLNLPIYCDFEYDSESYMQRYGILVNKNLRHQIINTFLRTLKNLGYRVGIYTNVDYLTSRIDINSIEHNSLWCAKYSNSAPDIANVDIWQYTSRGMIAPYPHVLDCNYLINEDVIRSNTFEPLISQDDPEPQPLFTRAETIHVVKKGETLSGIAKQFNTTYQRIAKDNNISNPNLIYVGQKLVINYV